MKKVRKLSRKRDQRQALIKGLAANLILKNKIKTTEAKAKEVRPFVERLVTKNRKADLNGARYAARFLPKSAVKKLISEVGPKYADRNGGYTRIIKLGQRVGDSARMAIIEFV